MRIRWLIIAACCLAGLTVWLGLRGPSLLEQLLLQRLASYGVESLSYEGFRYLPGRVELAEARLTGRSGGNAFAILVTQLAVDYRWRQLLDGRVDRLHAEQLVVEGAGGESAAAAPAPLNLAGWLPASVTGQVPADVLLIESLRLRWTRPGATPLVALGRLEVADATRLALTGSWRGLGLTVTAAADAQSPLDLKLAVDGGQQLLATLTADLEEPADSGWRWRLDGGAELGPLLAAVGREAQLAEGASLTGTVAITGELGHPPRLLLTARGRRGLLESLSADLSFSATLDALRWPGAVRQGSAAIQGGVSGDAGQWQVRLQPSRVEFNPDALEASERLSLHDLSGGLSWREDARPEVRLGGLLHASSRWGRLPSLEVALESADDGVASGLVVAVRDKAADLALDAVVSLDEAWRAVGADVALRAADAARLNAGWLPLLRGAGVPVDELQLAGGEVHWDAVLEHGRDGWRQRSELQVAGIGGRYGDYRFEGFDLVAAWQGFEQVQTTQPLRLSLASVFAGFATSDVEAVISAPRSTPLAAPRLRLDAFSAALFGGVVRLVEPVTWDFSAPVNRLSLRVEDWQLAELVALQGEADLAAEGVIDGELPVSLEGTRVTIDGGFLKARAPGGNIRYRVDAAGGSLAGAGGELSMALGLLQDFRFRTLDSRVDLDREGGLVLGLALEGFNPDRYEGRAVRFNINLEQDVDPLLQSLRLSGKLIEEIERKLQ
jgi:hypothetical protein